MPEVEIKTSKGNIAIDNKLYKKYSNAREIFDNESKNFNGNVKIVTDITDIIEDFDLTNVEDVKKSAIKLFDKYHDRRIFCNNGYNIKVTNKGIKESIQKIFYNDEQKILLKYNLAIFTRLGYIIEHSTLVTQGPEVKSRNGILYWNYYFDGVNINGFNFNIEIEVRSMERGENLYHIHRIELK